MIDVDSERVEAEVARWPGLGSHGLIGTTADGVLKVLIPGHNFGEPEILAKLEELLRLTGGGGASSSPAQCAKQFEKCKLPNGPLGICDTITCEPGQTAPCFKCMPQH